MKRRAVLMASLTHPQQALIRALLQAAKAAPAAETSPPRAREKAA